MAVDKKSIHNTFSFCQNFSKSINKKISSGEKITNEDIVPLSEAFYDVIDFIKAYLIFAQDTLYANILMSMDIDINYKNRGIIDLSTSGMNFAMSYNPLFLGEYSLNELITLTVAEILRFIFEHPSTYAKKNKEKNNKKHNLLEDASNASIYSLISKEIRLSKKNGANNGVKIPKNFYGTSDVLYETDMRPKETESIEYYFELLKNMKKRNSPNSASNLQQDEEKKEVNSENPQSQPNPNGMASPSNSDGQDTHDWENLDEEKTSERTKDLIHDVMNNMSSEARGLIPGSIMAQIEKLLAKPEISWKHILRKFVGSVPFPFRKTKKKLNRRQPERADLCGRMPKRKVRIVCCIDTSGSMSDLDIAYCMNEVFHIAKANETEITIVECDAQVGRVYIAKKPSDVNPKVTGRGGTYFTPAIEYINKDGKYKDALMIYFTDGYGESSIPKPRTYRNMWVVLHNEKNLSLREPFGEVKSLSMDGDYMKYKREHRGY